MSTSPCESCKREVVWALTAADNWMPVDPAPNSAGNLVLQVGYSHPVLYPAPSGITFTVLANAITISGADKALVVSAQHIFPPRFSFPRLAPVLPD